MSELSAREKLAQKCVKMQKIGTKMPQKLRKMPKIGAKKAIMSKI